MIHNIDPPGRKNKAIKYAINFPVFTSLTSFFINLICFRKSLKYSDVFFKLSF